MAAGWAGLPSIRAGIDASAPPPGKASEVSPVPDSPMMPSDNSITSIGGGDGVCLGMAIRDRCTATDRRMHRIELGMRVPCSCWSGNAGRGGRGPKTLHSSSQGYESGSSNLNGEGQFMGVTCPDRPTCVPQARWSPCASARCESVWRMSGSRRSGRRVFHRNSDTGTPPRP